MVYCNKITAYFVKQMTGIEPVDHFLKLRFSIIFAVFSRFFSYYVILVLHFVLHTIIKIIKIIVDGIGDFTVFFVHDMLIYIF